MFGYFKRNRAKVVVQSTMPTLREGIQDLSPVDRAATLAILNAMLEVAADQWGGQVLSAPARLPPDVAATAVLALAAHHSGLVRDGLAQMQDRGMDDVAYAQAMRETRATEMAIATVGACLNDGPKEDTAQAWALLWRARGHAAEAAAVLHQYGRHAKVDPVQRSRRRLQGTPPDELARLAATVPPFLRPRKPAAAAGARPAQPRPGAPAKPGAAKPGAKPAAAKGAPRPAGRPPQRPAGRPGTRPGAEGGR